MENKYYLYKLNSEDLERNLVTWQRLNVSSNDLNSLKIVCPFGFRIVDEETGKVVYEPK